MRSMIKRNFPVERISQGSCGYHTYYTHAAFHPTGRYFWYEGRRDGQLKLYVRDLKTGAEEALPGTDGVPAGRACLNRSGSRLYYLSGADLFAVDFPKAEASRQLAKLDGWRNWDSPFLRRRQGTVSAAKGSDSWFILAVDTESGRVRKVGRFPQEICHLQGSPGQHFDVLRSEGDWCVPQRIWLVEADGSNLAPLPAEAGRLGDPES